MRHVMLDLETLGNGNNAAIVAIGAVAFNCCGAAVQGEFAEGCEFYARVDPASAVELGLQVDVSTVLWWLGQGDAARAEIVRTGKEGLHLAIALAQFSDWYRKVEGGLLWGKGSDFDNVILSSAYKAAKLPQPWSHRSNRCFRTLVSLFPYKELEPPSVGVKHNALDDARWQAQHLVRIFQASKIEV